MNTLISRRDKLACVKAHNLGYVVAARGSLLVSCKTIYCLRRIFCIYGGLVAKVKSGYQFFLE